MGGRFVLCHIREGVPPPGTWGQRGLVAGLDLLQMWAIFFFCPRKAVDHKVVRKCSDPRQEAVWSNGRCSGLGLRSPDF